MVVVWWLISAMVAWWLISVDWLVWVSLVVVWCWCGGGVVIVDGGVVEVGVAVGGEGVGLPVWV